MTLDAQTTRGRTSGWSVVDCVHKCITENLFMDLFDWIWFDQSCFKFWTLGMDDGGHYKIDVCMGAYLSAWVSIYRLLTGNPLCV